jgi:cell division protein FtsL
MSVSTTQVTLMEILILTVILLTAMSTVDINHTNPKAKAPDRSHRCSSKNR